MALTAFVAHAAAGGLAGRPAIGTIPSALSVRVAFSPPPMLLSTKFGVSGPAHRHLGAQIASPFASRKNPSPFPTEPAQRPLTRPGRPTGLPGPHHAVGAAPWARRAPPSSIQRPGRSGLRMASDASAAGPVRSTLTLARRLFDSQFLFIGLVTALSMGLFFPAPGIWLGEQAITKYAAAGIFLISGIKLRTAEARAALKQRKAVVWGVASTLFLTCFLGVFINSRIPLPVPEFSLGLGVFLCMPCTINCGGALAVQSGGDFAMALLLTVLCSTLGVFTVPLLMERLLDFGVGVTLPVGEMIKKLFFMVLIPLALGKAMASSSQAAQATATKFDKPLTYLSSSLIILVPWIEVSRSAARGVFDAVSMGDMGALTALYGFIHITFFAANWAGSKVLGLSSETSKAVVFVASGKALPLALTVALNPNLSRAEGNALPLALTVSVTDPPTQRATQGF
ncbi:SBF-like CPA transporter family-domain-containing protein [Baffinella frigidus]|nr:SBF-like CPA transporter family-domain-containing protein [Cryptophyta sp. CCMP2293]